MTFSNTLTRNDRRTLAIVASVLAAIAMFSSTGRAQLRQSKLYIDNGSGTFLQVITNTLTNRQINIPDPGVVGADVLFSNSATGQTVQGGMTITGLTIPSGGSLTIANGGAMTVQSGGSLTVDNGGTLQVNGGTITLGLGTTLGASSGGTGSNAATYATDGLFYYDGSKFVTTSAGTAGEVLTSNGPGVAPSWGSAGSSIDLTAANNWTGTQTFEKDNIATTATTSAALANATATTAVTTVQQSPSLEFDAHVWNTTTPADNTFKSRLELVPVSGATPSANFNWDMKNNAGAWTNLMSLSSAGNLTATTFTGSGSGLTNVPAANITGTLPAGVLSTITEVGTITSGAWQGSAIDPTYGGTGVNNGSNTITLGGGNFAMSGGNNLTFTTTGPTNVTLPTSGTLVNDAVTTLSSLASVGTITTGTWHGSVIGTQYGGTGQTTYTDGQILIGNSATGGLTKATLTEGSNIHIVNSNGQIVISSTLDSNGRVGAVIGTSNRISAVGDSTVIVDIDPNYVGQASITTLGTVTTGTWNGTVISPTYGGTGVNNGTKTITLGGNLTTSGANNVTLTTTGATNVTLPTSGTLAALSGTNTWTGTQTFQKDDIKTTATNGSVLSNTTASDATNTVQQSPSVEFDAHVWNTTTSADNTETARLTLVPVSGATPTANLTWAMNNNGGGWTNLMSLSSAGNLSATTFTGSGSGLTNIPAANITGTLPAGVLSNITSTGTITSGTWQGSAIDPAYGGTGVNNGSNTIMLGGGNFAMSGGDDLTFTTTGPTNVTLPTSGTLVNDAVTTLSSLSSIGTITTGVWQGTAVGPTYGGTGITSYATGDILYADAANHLAKLPIGAAGEVLKVAGGVPTWGAGSTVDLTAANNWTGTQTFQKDDIKTTATTAAKLLNNTASDATNTVQYSPSLEFDAHAWNTTSTSDNLELARLTLIPVSGATPSANLSWAMNLNGGGYTNVMSLSSAGNLTATTFTGSGSGLTNIPAANITGTLPAGVLSNITSTGTITSGTWQGTAIGPTYGGTGVNNGSNTITLNGGNFAMSGGNDLTFTTTGPTNVTLPTSGTLVNSAVATLSSLSSIGTITTGTWHGSVIDPLYGGTGNNGAAYTTDGLFYYDGTKFVTTGVGNAGEILTSNGAGVAPSWSAAGGTGTVTNIATGAGLTGGPITTTGTIAIDYTSANTWTGTQTFKKDAIGTTATTGAALNNTTAATGGATVQQSPSLDFNAHVWNTNGGGSDNTFAGRVTLIPSSGNPPTGKFSWAMNNNGGGWVEKMSLTSAGNLTATTFTGSGAGLTNLDASQLSGTIPGSVLSNITSVGTVTSGTWQGTAISPTYGGTGVNNGSNTVTLGANFAVSGANAVTLTGAAGGSSVTLPASGTLVNSAVTTLSSLASIGTITTGVWNGTVINPTYGGTGVNNGSNTLTLGANLAVSGANTVTFTGAGGGSSVTLPASGTLVNSAVTTLSSLASIGTITTGVWNGTVVDPTYGGTGVNNGTKTITLGGNLTTSGANNLTLTTSGATNVTLPTSGTLVNDAVTTLSSLASIGTITTGVWHGTVVGIGYGGTGQITKTEGFDALSPNTTNGDMTYFNGSDNVRLAAGSTGDVLTISSGVPVWSSTASSSFTSLTAPNIYGGSVAGSTLNLQSTSSGSPSGDYVKVTTGGSERIRVDNSGRVGVGTTGPAVSLDINGDVATRRTDIGSLTNGTNNNVNAANTSNLRITGPTANFTITGLTGGHEGKRIHLYNATGYTMFLANQNTSSTDTCRIVTLAGGDIGLVPVGTDGSAIDLIYDGSISRWVATSIQSNQTTGVVGTPQSLLRGSDRNYSSGTLTNDTTLSFTVGASQTWEIDGVLTIIGSTSTTALGMAINIPGTPSLVSIAATGLATGTSASNGIGTNLISANTTVTANPLKCGTTQSIVLVHGVFTTGSTTGTVYMQFDLGGGSGTVTVQAATFMRVTRIQ